MNKTINLYSFSLTLFVTHLAPVSGNFHDTVLLFPCVPVCIITHVLVMDLDVLLFIFLGSAF